MRKKIFYEQRGSKTKLSSLLIRDAGIVASGEHEPDVFYVSFDDANVSVAEVVEEIGRAGWAVKEVVKSD